jgi:hypothetical protein
VAGGGTILVVRSGVQAVEAEGERRRQRHDGVDGAGGSVKHLQHDGASRARCVCGVGAAYHGSIDLDVAAVGVLTLGGSVPETASV